MLSKEQEELPTLPSSKSSTTDRPTCKNSVKIYSSEKEYKPFEAQLEPQEPPKPKSPHKKQHHHLEAKEVQEEEPPYCINNQMISNQTKNSKRKHSDESTPIHRRRQALPRMGKDRSITLVSTVAAVWAPATVGSRTKEEKNK